jgi:hypothetical protein
MDTGTVNKNKMKWIKMKHIQSDPSWVWFIFRRKYGTGTGIGICNTTTTDLKVLKT